MSASNLIKGKVAKIVDNQEVVINVGLNDGVRVGMRFDIISPKLEDIADPDSCEIIGSIKRAKNRVKVAQVHDKISIARTYRKKRVNVGGTGTLPTIELWKGLIDPPKWTDQPEMIKTRESTLQEQAESYVKTGDPIVQVEGDDKDM